MPAPRVPRSELFGALRGQIRYAEDDDDADAEIVEMFGSAATER